MIKVTRNHMIEAIKTEPLYKGLWVAKIVEEPYRGSNKLNLPKEAFTKRYGDCPVCAVGGTLRKAGIAPNRIGYTAQKVTGDLYAGAIPRNLRKGDYLSALSGYFEHGNWTTREDLVNWVLDNVPEDWEIEVPEEGFQSNW